MSPYRRNVMVGVVVLGGLLILAWMLIQFGAKIVTPFSAANEHVNFLADRADGISNGSNVLYRGVNVGRVERVRRAPDQLGVIIDAEVDRQPPLPGNLKAIIRSQGLVGGGAYIVLELTSPSPQGTVQPDQQIETRFVGLDILPPEFAELATELRLATRQFRESQVIEHIDQQVAKMGKLIESVQGIVDDRELRTDLRASLANLRDTTGKANQIADNLDKFSSELQKIGDNTSGAISDARILLSKTQEQVLSLSKQTSARLEQASRLLDQVQAIAEKVNSGQGTAGAMINDPKLYQSLVDTTRELNATVTDLRRLIEQWEEEGVSLKIK